VYDTSTLNRLR